MEADPFLQSFDSSDLKIAKEFLTNWMPFLARDLCEGCAASLIDRTQSLSPVDGQNRDDPEAEKVDGGVEESGLVAGEEGSGVAGRVDDYFEASTERWEHIKATGWDTDPATESPKVRMSWADELEEEEEEEARKNSLEDGIEEGKGEVRLKKTELSREQRERIRFTSVERKKDFVCLKRIDGKIVNILEGIELHTGVFSAAEQKKIVDFVYELQVKGRNNELGEHTYSEYSESRKSTLGKGCATIHFGCCFNYMEQNGNAPGILRNAAADPIPNIFKIMIKRLIGWHVMPHVSCVPDSCSVNIYEPGCSEEPNMESHDFVRPFCTVPFLTECDILFGFNLKADETEEAKASTPIRPPLGSVLVFNGKGANVEKFWLPEGSKRISITFRKMKENRRPLGFRLEPDLQNIRPYDLGYEFQSEKKENEPSVEIRTIERGKKFNGSSNGAKIRRNFRKDGASVFDRITPMKKSPHSSSDADFTINHSSIERARNCRAFFESDYAAGLQNHSDEAEEELQERSRRGWKNEEGGRFDRNELSNERSVRVEQKRIVITRNLDSGDDSFSRRSAEFSTVHPPQVRIRTLKNNQRRVRMNH